MARRLTIEYVRKSFKDEGYELLTHVYVNSSTPLKYRCPNGHEYQISWNKWKAGRRCPYCSKTGRVRKISINSIKVEMSKEGYKLLSPNKYKNSKQKLLCECPNGHEFETSWDSWKYKNVRCSVCSGNKRLTIDFVKSEFEKEGYILLTSTYKNAHSQLYYKCDKGHVSTTTWANWSKGNRCPECSGKKRRSVGFIKEQFNNEGYTLLSDTYTNGKQKLSYVCPNGHKHVITWNNWSQGQRCYKCSCSGVSKDEIEIARYIKNLGFDIIERDRNLISPYELDIIVPEKRVAIEYCGLYWHSELCGKDSRYHINKLNLCNEKGYTLITVFEDEYLNDKEIVLFKIAMELGKAKSIIIYARDTYVKEITTHQAKTFCNKYHLQGYSGSRIKLGLFHKDTLLAVMTFSKPSISKGSRSSFDDVFELNRFCVKCGYRIVGGASKLLTYFIRNNTCKHVFSYADRRWSSGKLYRSIGFELAGISKPNYWYIVDGKRIHRFSFRKRSNEPREISEWELRRRQGFNRIWDCGSLKFKMNLGG